MGHDNVTVQSAAWSPATFDRRAAWFDDGEKVVHDSIRDRFIENAFVAKCLQVQLKAFQLDADAVWDISNNDRSVVRLSRFWANRSKLGTMMFDCKIAGRAGVVKDFQQSAK